MRREFGPEPSANQLLAGLPAMELDRLRMHLTRVRLVSGQMLVELDHPSEHVFFIEEGIASMTVETQPGQPGVQVAMVGREGMVGGLALLDTSAPPSAAVVTQIAGPALRIRVADLMRQLADSQVLRQTCLRYLHGLASQLMQTAAFNARSSLAERCVRWLLMAHERIDGDEVPVTHEALSTMLGVRRSGVTVATMALQKSGLIETSRGCIRIVDPDGLRLAVGGRSRPSRAHHDMEPGASREAASVSDMSWALSDPQSGYSTSVHEETLGS